MGSVVSSENESPGSITADLPNRCAACGHHRREHDGPCGCGLCGGFFEPKGSGDSSPDDKCTCGCTRVAHMGKPRGCLVHGFHDFAPADAETAEPECPCIREGGCCHAPGVCLHGCREAADELSDEHREPEAPKTWPCGDCGANVLFELDDCPECERRRLASRRPPYAVAYALASGELYEVALPGDAVATAEGGVLKISHPQGVAHIIQVRPMETT